MKKYLPLIVSFLLLLTYSFDLGLFLHNNPSLNAYYPTINNTFLFSYGVHFYAIILCSGPNIKHLVTFYLLHANLLIFILLPIITILFIYNSNKYLRKQLSIKRYRFYLVIFCLLIINVICLLYDYLPFANIKEFMFIQSFRYINYEFYLNDVHVDNKINVLITPFVLVVNLFLSTFYLKEKK